MVEVVGQYTDLKKAGANFSGRCPFHEERTPSFSVNPSEKLYYCFGCGAGGNLIGFVMAKENMDFPEAVEYLADKYGIALEYEESSTHGDAERRRRERLRALLEQATVYYERVYREAKAAAPVREYLARRGLSDETCRAFRLGYSLPGWERLREAALGQGVHRAGPPGRRPRHPRQERTPVRPLPRTHHVPAGRRTRAHAGLRRPDARRREAQVPQLAGDAALPQERGSVRSRQGQGRGSAGGPCVRGGGLHRRHGPRPSGRVQCGREHGDGPDGTAAGASLAPHTQPLPVLRRGRGGHRRHAAGAHARPPHEPLAPRGAHPGRPGPGRLRPRRRGRRRFSRACR